MTTHTYLQTSDLLSRAAAILLEMQYAAIDQARRGEVAIVQRWEGGIYIHFALFNMRYGAWTIGVPSLNKGMSVTRSVSEAERILAKVLHVR